MESFVIFQLTMVQAISEVFGVDMNHIVGVDDKMRVDCTDRYVKKV